MQCGVMCQESRVRYARHDETLYIYIPGKDYLFPTSSSGGAQAGDAVVGDDGLFNHGGAAGGAAAYEEERLLIEETETLVARHSECRVCRQLAQTEETLYSSWLRDETYGMGER